MNKKKIQTKTKSIDFDITKFIILRDLLLVKALRPESVKGLTDVAQYEDKPEFGEVVRLGELVSDARIKVGSVIRFGKYSSETIRTKACDYYIIHEEDCSAFLP